MRKPWKHQAEGQGRQAPEEPHDRNAHLQTHAHSDSRNRSPRDSKSSKMARRKTCSITTSKSRMQPARRATTAEERARVRVPSHAQERPLPDTSIDYTERHTKPVTWKAKTDRQKEGRRVRVPASKHPSSKGGIEDLQTKHTA